MESGSPTSSNQSEIRVPSPSIDASTALHHADPATSSIEMVQTTIENDDRNDENEVDTELPMDEAHSPSIVTCEDIFRRITPDNRFRAGEIGWCRVENYMNGMTLAPIRSNPSSQNNNNFPPPSPPSEPPNRERRHPVVVLGYYNQNQSADNYLAVLPCSHHLPYPLNINSAPANDYTLNSIGCFETRGGNRTMITRLVPVVVLKSTVAKNNPRMSHGRPQYLSPLDFRRLKKSLVFHDV
ncbi:hypothetical protein CVT24_000308 [Panaeolus cyanescens]|uniref:Uncharacterized protein n=1 Tax=Panaeolus cyanescens TaxID=181874 RepID=A0A409YCV7_9AGAR|nr:hypothetical protein CVT24_000308 [Panaeolus cyanescens]